MNALHKKLCMETRLIVRDPEESIVSGYSGARPGKIKIFQARRKSARLRRFF